MILALIVQPAARCPRYKVGEMVRVAQLDPIGWLGLAPQPLDSS
jgi:hypothetical protein